MKLQTLLNLPLPHKEIFPFGMGHNQAQTEPGAVCGYTNRRGEQPQTANVGNVLKSAQCGLTEE